MYYRALISFALLLVSGLLAACDSGDTGTPECADIQGAWDFEESLALTCIIAGEREIDTVVESGIVFIEQNECDISFATPEGGFARTGTIRDDRVRLENPFVLSEGAGLDLSENSATADGTLTRDPETGHETIILDGTGIAEGSINGVPFSCTGNSRAELSRLLGSFDEGSAFARRVPSQHHPVARLSLLFTTRSPRIESPMERNGTKGNTPNSTQ